MLALITAVALTFTPAPPPTSTSVSLPTPPKIVSCGPTGCAIRTVGSGSWTSRPVHHKLRLHFS